MNKINWDMNDIPSSFIAAQQVAKELGIYDGYPKEIFHNTGDFEDCMNMFDCVKRLLDFGCGNIIDSFVRCPADDPKCHAPACWAACGEVPRYPETDEEFYYYDSAQCVKDKVTFCKVFKYCVNDGLEVLASLWDIYRGI